MRFSYFVQFMEFRPEVFKNDTLENRIVALEKIVEKLEDRIKNGTNSSKEGLFDCLFA